MDGEVPQPIRRIIQFGEEVLGAGVGALGAALPAAVAQPRPAAADHAPAFGACGGRLRRRPR
ncbi:hypothetical protein ACFVJ3_42610, partial [Rhodococcus sp. NPDC127593]|uniref:hypothetical protein n=1 Tax=Rhodococcus sp. NPDC127593 TaxID=3345404 RepID=UPI0036339B97